MKEYIKLSSFTADMIINTKNLKYKFTIRLIKSRNGKLEVIRYNSQKPIEFYTRNELEMVI